jgi:predicted enzyme related to lactoylglutathione lyase/transcriptional regulator with XRE-family HTH domain
MDMRTILQAEFARRRMRNPRYSLRAFASVLGTHHSTLSQILQSRRRLTPRTIRRFGDRLGLTAGQIRDACVAEHCASIRRVIDDPRFRADSRWIAMMTGISVDDVNVALHWLLYRGDLTMAGAQVWTLSEKNNAASSDSWQIISPDPDATTKFYCQLFDWQISRDNALGYRDVPTGEGGIDGGVWPSPPQERPFAQLFIEVADVEEHVKRASGLGAKVLVPPSSLPDGDVMAVLLDPVGLPFAVCTRRAR